MTLTEKQIKKIEKLTNSKYAKKGKYFYWKTGRGLRGSNWRLYLGELYSSHPEEISTKLWRNTFVDEMILIGSKMAINKEKHEFEWDLAPIPLSFVIDIGKILQKKNYKERGSNE